MKQVVRCLLLDKSKILLVKHNKSASWSLPGGHIESGETIYEAINREIKEEFNLEIELIGDKSNINCKNIYDLVKPISIYTISFDSKKYGNVTNLEFIFVAKVVGGEFKLQVEEIFDFGFFTKEEILEKKEDVYPQIIDLLKFI